MKIVGMIMVLLFSTLCYAEQRAITDKGEEVILSDDGTWKFVTTTSNVKRVIKTNEKAFAKDPEATFQVKSKINNATIFIDPKKWSFSKSASNDAIEYQLRLTDKDLRAMLITEKIEVPLETLSNLALENARHAAPDAKIVFIEYRIVNGKKVIMMQIDGTMQGIKFTYLGYYYSDSNGSTQLVTFTSQNLLPEYREEAEKFLNGLSF